MDHETTPEPMAPAVKTFQYHLHDVRIVEKGGEPWFVEVDVKRILNLRDHSGTSKLLDREKGREKIQTLGGPQYLNIISESGLYKYILVLDEVWPLVMGQ